MYTLAAAQAGCTTLSNE